ncbi:MAG TPA: hypothetical protein PLC79_07165, partial [Phycisphaerae bacterium]|nr:hypothetical protein [Phycisphaerae bacterium]
WDPGRDPQKLIDEFLDGYYGPAAPEIRAYLKLMHDGVEETGDALTCYSPPDAGFLTFGRLAEAWKHMQAAEAAAGNDAALRHRVQVAQLPVLYTFLVRWEPLRKAAAATGAAWPMPETIQAAYARFMEIAQAEKVTHVAEGRRIGWLKEVVDKAATQPAAARPAGPSR